MAMFTAMLVSAAMLGQVPAPPDSFPLRDSYYGDVTLTRVASGARIWTGVNIVTLPANPCCAGPKTFALHYTLHGDTSTRWNLVTQYRVSNYTTRCPIPSAAADPANQAFSREVDMTSRLASGYPGTSIVVNGSLPGTQCWPAYRYVTLTLVLP